MTLSILAVFAQESTVMGGASGKESVKEQEYPRLCVLSSEDDSAAQTATHLFGDSTKGMTQKRASLTASPQ